jgi:hypothetical protein
MVRKRIIILSDRFCQCFNNWYTSRQFMSIATISVTVFIVGSSLANFSGQDQIQFFMLAAYALDLTIMTDGDVDIFARAVMHRTTMCAIR